VTFVHKTAAAIGFLALALPLRSSIANPISSRPSRRSRRSGWTGAWTKRTGPWPEDFQLHQRELNENQPARNGPKSPSSTPRRALSRVWCYDSEPAKIIARK